jgi:hypothetical protein
MVPFLPLVACRHRFATSSTSRRRPGRVPSAHSRHLSGGHTVNRSLPPRKASCLPVHTSRRRPSIHHFLGIALPRHRLVPTSSGRPIQRQRVPHSFLAYPSTAWITFGISIRTVVRRMHSGKVLTRVHSSTIRRYLSHYLISPQIGRANNC